MKTLFVFTPFLLGLLVSTIYCVKFVGARGLLWAPVFFTTVGLLWFKHIGWRTIIPIFISLVGVLLTMALGYMFDLDFATDPGSAAP